MERADTAFCYSGRIESIKYFIVYQRNWHKICTDIHGPQMIPSLTIFVILIQDLCVPLAIQSEHLAVAMALYLATTSFFPCRDTPGSCSAQPHSLVWSDTCVVP